MVKVNSINFLIAIVLSLALISSGCRMRKKNRCNTCPKWSEETIKSQDELNHADV